MITYQIDFNEPEHVHFIGIGGISMSGLAEILLDEGFSISDSDFHETALTERLEKRGARVYYGQRAINIEREPGISAVVHTVAIHGDNPEFRAAKDQGLPMLSRAELLGELVCNYREVMAISGTHDKTTTTPMLTDVLLAGDLGSTISVGGILKGIGDNIHVGGPDLFVIEVCEYTNSFLSFHPTMEVILNIEGDHLDFSKDIEDICHSFRLSADKFSVKGLLVVNSGIEKVKEITKGFNCRMVIFGKDLPNTYTARNITYDEFTRPSYNLVIQGEVVSRITLGVTGKYNIYNSLTAIAVALELGVGFGVIMSGPGKFTGTDRRFEKKGEMVGVAATNDYAHHPQEIRVTLAAARNCPHRKLWYVLQSHIHTRARVFLDQSAEALSAADEVIPADIHVAQKIDTPGVSSRDVAGRIEKLGTKVHYIPSFDETETFILENCMNGDLLIAMGAGDTVEVGEKLLGQ